MNAAGVEALTPEELARCLRDVLGLLVLPATWGSKGSADILVSLAEVLEATVDLDLVLASARSDAGTIDLLRLHGAEHRERWGAAMDWFSPLIEGRATSVAPSSCAELGELTAIHAPIGYHAAQGYVVVASRRPGFPSPGERAVILAAVAMATTALATSRALEEREAALRAKDEFLAVLGHELRNPLAPIVTALELMLLRRGGGASMEEQIIARQVERLGRFVDDLLDIARITRGTLELKKTRVELAVLVDEAVEGVAELCAARRHTLRIEVPREGLPLDADACRLVQVIQNLLMNAAKYTPEGGQLEVVASAAAGRIVLSVRDNGIGIDAGLLPQVFEHFVQGRRSADPRYGGLGIGLALVRTLVTLHGGEVSARSEGRGLGSEFTVDLPLSHLAPASPTAPLPAPPPPRKDRSGLRIVVVDDNVDAGELLGMVLTLAGHMVTIFSDPLAILPVVDTLTPDLLVLDIGMPVLDGYELGGEIRRRLGERTPPMIALTGYGQEADRRKTSKAGFNAHLIKPVTQAALIACIEELCPARHAD